MYTVQCTCIYVLYILYCIFYTKRIFYKCILYYADVLYPTIFRCFTPPNRLYPSHGSMLSLSHHKKLNPMTFSNIEFNVPLQPQVSVCLDMGQYYFGMVLLCNTIVLCWWGYHCGKQSVSRLIFSHLLSYFRGAMYVSSCSTLCMLSVQVEIIPGNVLMRSQICDGGSPDFCHNLESPCLARMFVEIYLPCCLCTLSNCIHTILWCI